MTYLILTILISIVLVRFLFRKVFDLPAYGGPLLTNITQVENCMPEEKFWQLIRQAGDDSRQHYQMQCQLLTFQLLSLSEAEIIQFDRTFSLLMAHSYSYRLWEPVYAMNGGCSDDCFEYFRSWLIAQGKNKFYWTIKYPRLLLLVGIKEMIENYEGFDYCANEAYESKTGHHLPLHNDIQYPDAGNIFKEGEAFLRYPELALLAW